VYRLFRKKYAVMIGHGNSFFLVVEKSWKIIAEKVWSPWVHVVLGDTQNFMPQYVSWKSISILSTIAILDRAYH